MPWKIKTLTPAQLRERDALVHSWLQLRHGPVSRYAMAGLRGAASRQVLHGPMPNARQRLGLRTAKRKRAWAALFPGVPYPGRHGQRKPKE